jgi:hypothetical protein
MAPYPFIKVMKGYGTISALDMFRFWLSLDKGGRIEANLHTETAYAT